MFCCKTSKERQQPAQQAPPTEAADPAPGSGGEEPSGEENTRAGAPSTDDATDTGNGAPRETAAGEPNGANDESGVNATNTGDGESTEGAVGAEVTDRTLVVNNDEPNGDSGDGAYEEQPAAERAGDGEPTVSSCDEGVDGSSSIASPTRSAAQQHANLPAGAQYEERERSDSETDDNTAEFFRNRSRRYSSVVDIYPRTALPPKQTPRRTSEYRQRRSSREVSEDRHDHRRPSFTSRDGEVKESVGVSPMSSEDQDGLVLSFSSPPDSLPNMSTNRRDRDRRLVNESTSTPQRNAAAWVHEDVSVQTPSKDLSDAVTQTDKKVLRSPEQITTAVEHMVSPYPQEAIDRELSVSPRDKGQSPPQAQQPEQSRTSEGAREERRRSVGGSLSRSMDTAAESSFEPTTQALLQSTDTSSSSPNSESKQPDAFEENKNPETQNEKALSSERERRSSAAPSVGSRLRSTDEASPTSRSRASMSVSTKEIDDPRSPVQSSRKASSVHDSDARRQNATGNNNGGMRPLSAVVNGGPAQSSKGPEPSAPPSCVVAVTSQTPSRELTSTINASREAAVALTKSRKADRCRALDHLPSSGPWLRGNALIDAVVSVYPTFDRDDIAAAIQSFATVGDSSNANSPLLSHHAFTACGSDLEYREPWLSSRGAYLSAVAKSTDTVQDKRDTSPARKKASGTPSRVNPYLLPLLVRAMVVPDDVAAYLGKFITTSPEAATIAYEALIESAPSAPSDPKSGQTKPSDAGTTTSHHQPPSAKVARSPGRRRSSTLSPLPAGAAPSTSILSPMQSFRKDEPRAGQESKTYGLPAPMTHQGQGVMLRGQVPYHTVLSTKPWVKGLDARLVAMHAALELTSEAATAVAMVVSGGRRFTTLDDDEFANHYREYQACKNNERSPDPMGKESDVADRGVLPALSAAKDRRNCESMATPQSGHHDHHDHHSSIHDSIQRGSRLSAARASQERSQERSGSSRLAITPSVARRLDTGSPQRGGDVFESRTGKTNRGEETTVAPRSVVSCLRRNCALRSTAATDRQGLGQREEGHGATLLSVHTPGQLSVLHEVLSIHSLLELSVSTDRFVFNQHYTHALQRTQIFQDSECVERLGRLKNLRHLHVQSADFGSTGVGFAAIARLPNLSVLRLPMASFSSCQRQFQELAALGQKRSNGAALVHLDLSNANVSMKEMSVIGEFEELTMLDLSGCPQVTDKAFRFLLNMKHLTTIGLGGTKVGASVVKVLQAQIPGLNIQ